MGERLTVAAEEACRGSSRMGASSYFQELKGTMHQRHQFCNKFLFFYRNLWI